MLSQVEQRDANVLCKFHYVSNFYNKSTMESVCTRATVSAFNCLVVLPPLLIVLAVIVLLG